MQEIQKNFQISCCSDILWAGVMQQSQASEVCSLAQKEAPNASAHTLRQPVRAIPQVSAVHSCIYFNSRMHCMWCPLCEFFLHLCLEVEHVF